MDYQKILDIFEEAHLGEIDEEGSEVMGSSSCSESVENSSDEDMEDIDNPYYGCNFDSETALDSKIDIEKLNIKEISSDEIMRYHFPDRDVAFMFYNRYGCLHGFSGRKCRVVKNIKGEVVQQTFVCHREGIRDSKNKEPFSRKRAPRPNTRCGCRAKIQVHLDFGSGRWYIKLFDDIHNHSFLDDIINDMIYLKTSCDSMKASIETLGGIAKSNGGQGSSSNIGLQKSTEAAPLYNDVEHFNIDIHLTDDLIKIGSKRKDFKSTHGLLVENEPLEGEEAEGVMGSKSVPSSFVSKEPVFPGIWMKSNPAVNPNPNKSAKKSIIIKTEYQRTSDSQPNPFKKGDGVTKKLFPTPPPKEDKGQCSKSNGKGKQVVTEDLGESTHKKPKSATVIPKEIMRLMSAPKEVQACKFLFQKTTDAKVLEEILVKTRDLTATRADLFCLKAKKPITDLVITLAAEKVTYSHYTKQLVWCLPPSFEVDYVSGMPLEKLREKYCGHWMTPFPHLKFIYIPLKTIQGHWFLMIVHLEKGITYHLDTYCPSGCIEPRKLRIKKLGLLLFHLMMNAHYSVAFRNKRIDYQNYKIVQAMGIPNTGNSANSGVWVLDWIDMEHLFDPDNLYGTLKENKVRMKIGGDLMLGCHNELFDEVVDKTEAFINKLNNAVPIHVGDD